MAIIYNCFIFIHMKRKERMKQYSSVYLAVFGRVCYRSFNEHLGLKLPKNMQKDAKDYWTSNEPPRLEVLLPSESDSALEPKDFGGPVYSPVKNALSVPTKGPTINGLPCSPVCIFLSKYPI